MARLLLRRPQSLRSGRVMVVAVAVLAEVVLAVVVLADMVLAAAVLLDVDDDTRACGVVPYLSCSNFLVSLDDDDDAPCLAILLFMKFRR